MTKIAPGGAKTAQTRPGGTRTPWGVLVTAGLIVAGLIGVLGYMAISADDFNARIDREAERFQAEFWAKPIPPQGKPPARHADITGGLHPEDCGRCHYRQLQDWKSSFHAKTMGPGVLGQFPGMNFSAQSECLNCHAPLSEQWAQLREAGNWRQNGAYDAALRNQGLVCAACHLRSHQRFGPPIGTGEKALASGRASAILHGEPVRTPFFRASEFCKGCHQHAAAFVKVNGKSVENTYQEWLASPYPGQGKTCQSCHMPGGRHVWRGIHDPEMTRSGVTITTALRPELPVTGEKVEAVLTLANTGTGHAFPTYTTPAVVLKAAFLDTDGKVLPGDNYEERVLQRRLNMETSPWSEHFDTRVLPGQQASLEFGRTVPEGAAHLFLWIWVEPDRFYSGFYQGYLNSGSDFPGGGMLVEALNRSINNQYLLFSEKIPVQRPN